MSEPMSQERQIVIGQVLIVALFLGSWELATRTGWIGPDLLAPFSTGVANLVELLGTPSFLRDFGATAGRVAIAFAIGAPAALLAGVFIGEWRAAEKMTRPAINFALGIPQSIFLPIFILIFGIGAMQKIVFGITHLFFVTLVNTIGAVQSIPKEQVVALRSFGASRWQIYTRLYLPGMLPLVLTGLRLGMIFNILGVLLAEMYASQTGLGKAIFTWGESGDTVRLTAALIAVSASTILINRVMYAFERRAYRYQLAVHA
jgi:ABC-type nitrate/sulfonate/bicarbonate transport system permease component